jgi:peptidoglycan/xylan/chitin deacetylase (PgdA/CDA1 family)
LYPAQGRAKKIGRKGFQKVARSAASWTSALAVRAAPSSLAAKLTPLRLVSPCYHLVSDEIPDHVRHLYRCRDVNQFAEELDCLLKRFEPISLEDLSSRVMANEPLPPRSLFISFDDGLRECVEIVAPVCRAKGVPVTFFITTAFVGNRSLFYRHKASLLAETYSRMAAPKTIHTGARTIASFEDFRAFVLGVKHENAKELDQIADQLEVSFDEYLKTERPYLTEGEINSLIRQGFSIGGHSVDHPRYSEICLEQQVAQTRECIDDLGAKFPFPIPSFAFPFLADGVSELFVDQIFDSNIVDLMFYTGALRPSHNGRVIWRFGVESGSDTLVGTWKKNIARQQMDRIRSLLSPVAR